MSDPLCPKCGHPTRRHDAAGCGAMYGDCRCDQTRATLARLDELPAPAPAVFVEPEPVPLPVQLVDLARREPTTDSPAGVDGAHGVAHRPGDDLPGTSPAPDVNGHEASPVRGGEEEDPAVEAQTPAVTAGPVPFGITYLCPDLHARCRCTPIRWRVLLERITDGE